MTGVTMTILVCSAIGLLLFALSANREVPAFVDQGLRCYPAAASTRVFQGGFVGLAAGYARALVAGDRFCGLADGETDNSAGDAGAKKVRVWTVGDFLLTLAGAAITDIGRRVYASDDGTLTFSAAGNSYVGYMIDLHATNKIILRLDVQAVGTQNQPVVSSAPIIVTTAENQATLIPAALNPSGLILEEVIGVITTQMAGATQDQGIITLKDSDGNSLAVTLTPSDGGADAVSDVVVAAGTNKTAERGSTGDPLAIVPAGKGLVAVVTQTCSGAGAAGAMRVIAKALPVLG